MDDDCDDDDGVDIDEYDEGNVEDDTWFVANDDGEPLCDAIKKKQTQQLLKKSTRF